MTYLLPLDGCERRFGYEITNTLGYSDDPAHAIGRVGFPVKIRTTECSGESYQKWTARTFGGPCAPETTLVEMTTCIFFRYQSRGAWLNTSEK